MFFICQPGPCSAKLKTCFFHSNRNTLHLKKENHVSQLKRRNIKSGNAGERDDGKMNDVSATPKCTCREREKKSMQ